MTDKPESAEPLDVAPLVASGLALALCAWLLPVAVTWAYDGAIGTMTVGEAIVGTLRLVAEGHWSAPANAYPPDARTHMPAALGWWLAAGWLFATTTAIVVGVWRRLEPAVARTRLGRRDYDPRGRRPRAWALPRDVPSLSVPARTRERFTLGRLDRRTLASDPEAHVAVVAPTRSGKTTRCVVPWLLEHSGPAIITSTKTDVVLATREWRERLGRVQVWDPFGPTTSVWNPTERCDEWKMALLRAQWLADAVQERESEIAAYWRGEAAKLIAPLLHAAALDERPVADILAWVDAQDAKTPGAILAADGAEAAKRQLDAVANLDPRNRGTTYMSAGSLLAAYRYRGVADREGSRITVERFLDGGPNTLYVVASERQQRLLAPLVVAMLTSILDEVAARANRGVSLDPTLRVLLDEAANVAPLRTLPAYLSQAASHGIRFATIWQSIAQMRSRYRESADAILANSTTKLFMGPVGDEATLSYLTRLLGERRIELSKAASGHAYRPKASAHELQQLQPDRAVLIEGRMTPAVIHMIPWWEDRLLRGRATRRSVP